MRQICIEIEDMLTLCVSRVTYKKARVGSWLIQEENQIQNKKYYMRNVCLHDGITFWLMYWACA
jgi:hypothetical protein